MYWPRVSPQSILVFSSDYNIILNASIANNCIIISKGMKTRIQDHNKTLTFKNCPRAISTQSWWACTWKSAKPKIWKDKNLIVKANRKLCASWYLLIWVFAWYTCNLVGNAVPGTMWIKKLMKNVSLCRTMLRAFITLLFPSENMPYCVHLICLREPILIIIIAHNICFHEK